MSRIVVTMNVSITEEYYDEFLKELESKGYVEIPYKTREGIITVKLTKLGEA